MLLQEKRIIQPTNYPEVFWKGFFYFLQSYSKIHSGIQNIMKKIKDGAFENVVNGFLTKNVWQGSEYVS